MPTFSEQDTREVFARAARLQQAAEDAPDAPGLTLDELQEIGRAAGLDPAHVAAAAASLGGTVVAAPERKTRFGVPTEIRRTRRLPGPLSDAAWERAVEHLRAEFKTPGTPGQVGRIREWAGNDIANRGSRASLVHVAARPAPNGDTEVVLEHRGPPVGAQVALGLGLSFVLIAGVLLVLSSVTGNLPALAPLLMASFAGTTAGIGWVSTRHGAHQLGAQFDAVLDRVERLAREDVAVRAPAETAPEPQRIDIDALGDLAPEPETRGRTRVR